MGENKCTGYISLLAKRVTVGWGTCQLQNVYKSALSIKSICGKTYSTKFIDSLCLRGEKQCAMEDKPFSGKGGLPEGNLPLYETLLTSTKSTQFLD